MASVTGELIGPLTAAEWCEFRRRDDDEDLLYCCGSTSALRDSIFHLLRNGGDPLSARGFVEAFSMVFPAYHTLDEMGERGSELLMKLAEFYMK